MVNMRDLAKSFTHKRPATLGDKAEYMEESRLAHKEREQDALKSAVFTAEKKMEDNSMTKAVNHLRK